MTLNIEQNKGLNALVKISQIFKEESSILSEDRQFAIPSLLQDRTSSLEESSSASGPWQTASLTESWASVSGMESELGGLETSEMVLVQEEHSKNHFSTSEIIQPEADLYQRAESDDEEEELQSSVLSMIELEEIRALPAESDLKAPQTTELLMCMEEPVVEEFDGEMASETVFTHTPILSDPLDFTLASVPIPEIIAQVLDHLPTSTVTVSEEPHASESECINAPRVSASSSEEVVSKADPLSAAPFELPVLLVGGAALVAVVGILTYTLIRK